MAHEHMCTGPECEVSSSNFSELDDLVMEYLVKEGYVEAAHHFSKSRQTTSACAFDLEGIEERQAIRRAIQVGDIDVAVGLIIDHEPLLLEQRPDLHFHLLLQSAIEYVRMGRTEDALALAQDHLAIVASENEPFVREFEDLMMVIVFGQKAPGLEHMLSFAHRNKLSNEVNEAILEASGQEGGLRIVELLRLLTWMQDTVKSRLPTIPLISDFLCPRLEANTMQE